MYIIIRYSGGEDHNLAGTISTRLPIMAKARRFVFGYCLFWVFVIVIELSYLGYYGVYSDSEKYENFTAIGWCLAFRGPFALGIIFFSSWESLTWEQVRRSKVYLLYLINLLKGLSLYWWHLVSCGVVH